MTFFYILFALTLAMLGVAVVMAICNRLDRKLKRFDDDWPRFV